MKWFAPLMGAKVRRYGQPPRVIRELRDQEMARLLDAGTSQRDIAKLLGISRTSVQKRMRKS
jgi:DNA invertase Pin-like site-specific DNA recombinase